MQCNVMITNTYWFVQDLTLSQLRVWRILCSEMWYHTVWQNFAHIHLKNTGKLLLRFLQMSLHFYQTTQRHNSHSLSQSYRAILILTVQSSEHEAMMLSLKGFHFTSRTGPLCPVIRLALKSNLPVCNTSTKWPVDIINHKKFTHISSCNREIWYELMNQ
jgi:hypothetical protein